MAIHLLSRRLLNPSKLLLTLIPKTPTPTPKPLLFPLAIPKPTPRSLHPFPAPRHFSTAPPSPPHPSPPPEEMRHQEIEGPTVERDESALANETREVLDALRGSIRGLSNALGLLGAAHLGLGAWLAFAAQPRTLDEVSVQGLMAFAFPFTAALVMRRALKPIAFFRKMEANGRLQILTLCLQVSKNVNLMLLRTRVVAISCVVGVSTGAVVAVLMR